MSVAPLKFHVDDAEGAGSVIRALGERSPEQAAPARSTKTKRRRFVARIIGRTFLLFRGVVGREVPSAERPKHYGNSPSIITARPLPKSGMQAAFHSCARRQLSDLPTFIKNDERGPTAA